MNRRNFIQLSAAGGLFGAAISKYVFAGEEQDLLKSKLAGRVFYTEAAPGRWAKKMNGHLPKLSKITENGKNKIRVITAHEMKNYQHYIMKHILLDKDFNFMAETLFDPVKDKAPMSTFEIGNYKGVLYVMSVCNKHDTWINTIQV